MGMVKLSTYNLQTPIGKKELGKLKLGDILYLSGQIFSMRDRAHTRALEKGVPLDLKGGVVFHCGPLVSGMRLVSAGPTTSSRMNSVTPNFIKKFGISALIGKGGMDEKVSESMRGTCVYLSFTGGCGVLAASSLEVKKVFWRDLGETEALWVLDAKKFGPLLVSMDSKGNSIYREVGRKAEKNPERLQKWD